MSSNTRSTSSNQEQVPPSYSSTEAPPSYAASSTKTPHASTVVPKKTLKQILTKGRNDSEPQPNVSNGSFYSATTFYLSTR
ncbi:hypothetical protein AOQ84DRAFT_352149 [Glonium stellatum]|uniref:Uncharacterized protein n=1 Tax=Glonium stellatum TaxID=574774 RepID=A0A8E2F9P9_9PEZI|nr:hypothetical protein AOQ84DRAFT_352149 [Glonium stellatum]